MSNMLAKNECSNRETEFKIFGLVFTQKQVILAEYLRTTLKWKASVFTPHCPEDQCICSGFYHTSALVLRHKNLQYLHRASKLLTLHMFLN